MFDLWPGCMEMIITACFYMRIGILASLGFVLQTSGHRPFPPGCILCCSLWCLSVSLPSHHYLPGSFLPSALSHSFQLSGIQRLLLQHLTDHSASLSWALLPISSSSQFCLQCLCNNISQYLSGIKWDNFYSVPGNGWTFRNVSTFFPDVF